MDVWGAGSFENDVASDWAGDLADGGDVAMVRAALSTASTCPGDEALEAEEGAEALAAAEVVAAAAGRPVKAVAMGSSGPHALAWAAGHTGAGSAELIALALDAVDRVGATASELQERWSAEEDVGAEGREWFGELEDLRNRLAG
jgi:hypothetical protein